MKKYTVRITVEEIYEIGGVEAESKMVVPHQTLGHKMKNGASTKNQNSQTGNQNLNQPLSGLGGFS